MPTLGFVVRAGIVGVIALAAVFATWAADQEFHWPLIDGYSRATPLHFGLYVTPDPDENPIDPPERFTGYHVATDFEITPDEAEKDIPVYAICSGPVAFSGFAEGYGGLLIQRCTYKGSQISVIYGHLLIAPLLNEGVYIERGKQISSLAKARTYESGGNRKHLHLGIHKGPKIDFRGYVQTEEEVATFIDPLTVLPVFPPVVGE